MNTVFVTTTTPDYSKAWVFPGLEHLSDRIVCLLDDSDDRRLPDNCERVSYKCEGVIHQDGRFVDTVPGLKDDDIVILLDADGVIQRDLNYWERAVLNSMNGSFAMGYNVHPGQQGEEEYNLLKPKLNIYDAAQKLGTYSKILRNSWIYNTGMMAARTKTWRQLKELMTPIVDKKPEQLFEMHSWPQYIICCSLFQGGVPVAELGYETHSHGHFRLPDNHKILEESRLGLQGNMLPPRRRLYYDGQLVFFAHNVNGITG
jgi:hypothetical protein